ncbi:MAG: TDP-N-acetylfucosamine:lipid II N-acetylfucosaminyltransferase [Clostridia bacterium]|nr:TDP-N-acetylfucosamine:lipid II N-acetylfucosaminyltransferase [Clostridia bacterium]
MTIRPVKYLHIIWYPDLKFIPKFVKMINEETLYFDKSEHLFLTPYKNVFDALKNYTNVVLAGKNKQNLIKAFGKKGEWIFVHALNCSKIKLLFTPKKLANKVIWRTWGHDLVQPNYSCGRLKSLLKKFFWKLYVEKIRQFKAVAIANDVDAVAVKSLIGDIKTCALPYSYIPNKFERLEEIYQRMKENSLLKGNRPFRILVGHSGSITDRHIEVLEYLKKFKKNDIIICLILSYGGTQEYYRKVLNYAINIFGNKVEVVTEKMEYFEFAKYLSEIDLACFNQLHSAGLGCLSLLYSFDKAVVFSADSPFVVCLKNNNCKYQTFETLQNMDINELRSLTPDPNSKKIFVRFKSIDDICMSFKETLDSL